MGPQGHTFHDSWGDIPCVMHTTAIRRLPPLAATIRRSDTHYLDFERTVTSEEMDKLRIRSCLW